MSSGLGLIESSIKEMVTNNLPDSNVPGTLRLPLAKKSPAIGSCRISDSCSAWAACCRTLKASHNIAQGKCSGVAAKRHPGFGFNDGASTL